MKFIKKPVAKFEEGYCFLSCNMKCNDNCSNNCVSNLICVSNYSCMSYNA
ncbi:Clo7bot family Cys-rich peptide [Paraclostridium ghonii]|nr:Clo7bot family Cys-rich peptide [Paeniclostridium ghonii]MCM0165626.1 Clo7bot family Cys-rich peptide [Paeniclostridium ghonii]